MFPKIVTIGGFFIPTYGVLVASGFLAALWLASRLGTRRGLNGDSILNLGIYSALAGLGGAKLTMILFNLGDYLAHPGDIFTLSFLQAAGVYQGGLVLALVVAWAYVRHARLPVLGTFDVFAPGLALGHGIGRLGCFAAGCCWGKETHLPWAVTFHNPDAHELVGTPLNLPLHPTQLYEAFSEFLICALLLWYLRKPRGQGSTIGLYLVLYSLVRFLVEFVRNHEQALPFGLPLSITQWMSLGLGAVGVYLLVRRAKARDGRAASPTILK